LGVSASVCLKGKEKMRIAILAAMVIVALSSNPFIHRESAIGKKCAAQPVQPVHISETTPKPANTLENIRLRSALRCPVIALQQAYGY
jgi:hypothetical protein